MKSDRFWLCVFLVAALILYGFNLGEVPLRDWDEGTVATVARNIWRSRFESKVWLYPTMGNDRPYWNKPPLIHWLIAYAYSWFGVSEWSTRLFPALLSALSVPLLYKIGREIFTQPMGAIFSTLVYLTLLPIVRHGRLAMLDGAIACWFTLTFWCLLRGRSRPQWLFGVGLGVGLACLTKGMVLGVLLGGIGIIFLVWDTPKLLRSGYFWGALLLGIVPAIAWYVLQYCQYGVAFFGVNLGQQTFNRILEPIENHANPPWYYLIEIVKYTLPWLLFLPGGVKLAIRDRRLSWAKLTLSWGGIYLVAVSLMGTKLPWYIIPFYPAFSWLIGANLANIWHSRRQVYPHARTIAVGFLALVSWGASLYYGLFSNPSDRDLQLILAVIGFSLTVATALLWFSSRYFLIAIAAGLYLALLLLFKSHHWVWEIAEAYPVKPVAANIKQHTPPQQIIYTSYPNQRPSLDFYSDRAIVPLQDTELKQHWQQEPEVYLLVDADAISRLNLERSQTLGYGITWQLITRSDNENKPEQQKRAK